MAIFQWNLRRTDVRHIDVTNHLKQMALADVRMRLNHRTFGVDPDMGHAKVLRI
jgi:hypothetical protein